MWKHVLVACAALGLSATAALAGEKMCAKITHIPCPAEAPRVYTAPPRVHAHTEKPPLPRHHRVDREGHDSTWMQKQGFTACHQVRDSCYRGAKKPGHGLKYRGVCEDRYNTCLRTGCWHTTNTGDVCRLARH